MHQTQLTTAFTCVSSSDDDTRPRRGDGVIRDFDTRALDEFATVLASVCGRQILRRRSLAPIRVRSIMKVILEGARAVRFHAENAQHTRRRSWAMSSSEMKELGYSDAFAERATKEIITRLAVN